MYQYLSLSRLLHYKGEGVLKKLFEIENQLFSETADKLTDWGKQRPSPQEMKTFQEKLAIWAYESLRKAFPDIETSD
jgi:hypothetical protein